MGVEARNACAALGLAPIGPDPASESACTVGGVVANNSSGMACGTELNSHAILDSTVLEAEALTSKPIDNSSWAPAATRWVSHRTAHR